MKDHCSYAINLNNWENKAWKNSPLNRIQTHHDRCDNGAVLLLTELSSQLAAGHFVSL